jgi:hypothetical protein
MITVYRLIVRILTIMLLVFVAIVYIDLLRSLNGSTTILIHLHHNIFDAFTVSMICIVVYIILLYIDIINKHRWKQAGLLTIGIVITLTSSFIILDKYSKKANVESFRYVKLLFSEGKLHVDVRCETNARRDYELFSQHFDMTAVKDIQHFPILGRHIFLVEAKGITPFLIDISVSFDQTISAWIHLQRESQEEETKGPGLERGQHQGKL